MANQIAKPFWATIFLRWFGWSKVALIFYIRPKVIEISDERVEIMVPLNRRTRNHWGAMCFGTLAIGADCAAGVLAVALIREAGDQVSFLFKDVKGEFLKRADGDAHFISQSGAQVRQLVRDAIETGERCNLAVPVDITVPKKYGNEVVARMTLTLSLKKKK